MREFADWVEGSGEKENDVSFEEGIMVLRSGGCPNR
jgi:hypothetical protein